MGAFPSGQAGKVIADENYWARKVALRWRNAELRQHGGSFKQCFFERTVTEALESCAGPPISCRARPRRCRRREPFPFNLTVSAPAGPLAPRYDPETSNLEDLRRLIAFSACAPSPTPPSPRPPSPPPSEAPLSPASRTHPRRIRHPTPPDSPYVRTVAVAQLPSHLELSHLLRYCLSDLTALRLTYGAAHCGMDYERSLFGMTLGDVQGLAQQLPLVETLHTLDLTNSVLDDEKARGGMRMRCDAVADTRIRMWGLSDGSAPTGEGPAEGIGGEPERDGALPRAQPPRGQARARKGRTRLAPARGGSAPAAGVCESL